MNYSNFSTILFVFIFSPSSKSEYIRYSEFAHFSKSNYILCTVKILLDAKNHLHVQRMNLHQNTLQFVVLLLRHRGSWWWSPPHSTCHWCTPSAPRPTAAWSRSRWAPWPRRGCSSPPGWEASPCVLENMINQLFTIKNFLPFGGASPGPVPPYHILDTLRGQNQQNWNSFNG